MSSPDQKDSVQELLHLGFQNFEPDPSLRLWVESYWAVRANLPNPSEETMYPDGGSSLLFHFAQTEHRGAWFSATQSIVRVVFEGEVDGFGVRFFPGGAHALLGLELHGLIDNRYALTDLGLPDAERLFQDMTNVSNADRISLLESWLRQCATGQKESGPVQKLWPALRRSETDIDQDLHNTGISRRRFERLFRQQTGMAPNKFKMLWRIKQARYLIKTRPQLPLTEVALQCGYFDQAHFNHQFRAVAGVTPGEYRSRQLQRIDRQEMIIR